MLATSECVKLIHPVLQLDQLVMSLLDFLDEGVALCGKPACLHLPSMSDPPESVSLMSQNLTHITLKAPLKKFRSENLCLCAWGTPSGTECRGKRQQCGFGQVCPNATHESQPMGPAPRLWIFGLRP